MSKIIRTSPSAIFSKAVEFHHFIFTQGMTASDLSLDIAGQSKSVLTQLDALLEEHGTDNTRLLQAQVWLKNIADKDIFNKIWEEWLPKGEAPARACVQAEMVDPRMLVEVMLIATK
ncbi:RidA family protein [Entomobacter blattae]|uniref:Aminoacrylate peracid reductase RutC n=1 Tax=Entomobacter blattae TaxID=2762277 RepID=A0A7H1NQA2_9PROT|nr:RidA family protein [Entomobacter blattae]QNT77962.1 Putative aminoacrylate peracid reductase RutC [Entomobacter blattae]